MQQNKISVVIICKDAEATIEAAIRSALLLTDDVVVVDSGSSDGTIEKIKESFAKLVQIEWTTYGDAKNTGNKAALNDWILSLDADERLDNDLITSVKKENLQNPALLFTMQRLNYLGLKQIYFGEWGKDIVLRLFNRQNAIWDNSPVHEALIVKERKEIVRLKGKLHHFTAPNIEMYKRKLEKYAKLNAEKYFLRGKKAYWYKIYFSPFLNFIQNYIFKAGFLDGKEGLQIAIAHSNYTFLKYKLLKEKYRKEF